MKIQTNDLQKQINNLKKKMLKQLQNCDSDKVKYVAQSCAAIEKNAKEGMRDTQINQHVVYGPHGHHPSLPYNPPAPDYGTLLQSITFDVQGQGQKVSGQVGSLLKKPAYPAYPVYLEYGTSKMLPHPWLKPSLENTRAFRENLFKEMFGK